MPFDPYFERCFFCEEQLHYLQYITTKDQLNVSLCSGCEKDYREKCKQATAEEQQLFLALRKAKIPATLQHHDGFKTVDIAIEELNLHHQNPDQALRNLKRTAHTIRNPNGLVKDKIAETVKNIRNLYDVRPGKRKSDDRSRPGLLF